MLPFSDSRAKLTWIFKEVILQWIKAKLFSILNNPASHQWSLTCFGGNNRSVGVSHFFSLSVSEEHFPFKLGIKLLLILNIWYLNI